jgi:hypothetical protein
MSKLYATLRNTVKILFSYFPTPLPVGMTAYNAWLTEVIALVGPVADEQSMAWVISNEIMRLPPGKDRVPKRYFVKSLRKFAANQIAGAKVLELKEKQEQKKEAEATAAAADVKQ